MIQGKKSVKARLFPIFKRHFVALAEKPAAASDTLRTKTVLKPHLPTVETFYHLNSQANNRYRYSFNKESDKIGQGFFASVYKALDAVTMENVAVKVVDKKKVHRQVFKQELRVMEQLKQEMGSALFGSALAVHSDVFETPSELNFVFKLFRGGDLCDDLIDNGGLTEEQAKTMMRRLVPGIVSMHKRGFLHRDIKAENILLSDSSDRLTKLKNCMLTDFGYAKKLVDADAFSNPAGTFGFVAPEVLSTRLYSPACDIWSLGAVLFTAKAAYQPFPHLDDGDDLYTKTTQNLTRKELEAINHYSTQAAWEKEMVSPAFENTSAEFKDLLQRMLTINPRERITGEEILAHPWMQDDRR